MLKLWSSSYIVCGMCCCQCFGGTCHLHREGNAIPEARLLTIEDPRFQDNRHIKVVRLFTHWPPLPPMKYSRYALLSWHIAAGRIMTPWGIKPPTFRLVAQCLIQLRHPIPPILSECGRNGFWKECVWSVCLIRGIRAALTTHQLVADLWLVGCNGGSYV
jgi:hypothetical protein